MGRLAHIDGLRGIASLLVCWFHMTHGGELLGEGVAAQASSYGFLGVEVFFVISGFVIPLSMWKARYQWRNFGDYFFRRLLRVHPPFLVACVLAIGLNLMSMLVPGYRGSLPDPYLPSALASLASDATYLSGILGRSWILVVAWTLAIEVQFYVLAGLILPLLSPGSPKRLGFGLIILAASALVFPDGPWIFSYLPYFSLGWAAAWRVENPSTSKWGFLFLIAGIVGVMMLSCSLSATAVAVSSFLFILLWSRPVGAVWKWLGAISYSLYLVHAPIGGRVVNLAERWAEGPWALAAVAVLATLVSLAAAWGFWRLVEWPIHQLSRRFKKVAAPCPEASESVS